MQAFLRSLGKCFAAVKGVTTSIQEVTSKGLKEEKPGKYRTDNTVETIILRQRYTQPCLLFSTLTDLQEVQKNMGWQALAFSACRYLG